PTHPAPTEISTLSLHDALPILGEDISGRILRARAQIDTAAPSLAAPARFHIIGSNDSMWCNRIAISCHGIDHARSHQRHHRHGRSEEHTSELQSRENLVCRLLL